MPKLAQKFDISRPEKDEALSVRITVGTPNRAMNSKDRVSIMCEAAVEGTGNTSIHPLKRSFKVKR